MLLGLPFLLSLERKDSFLKQGGRSCQERGKNKDRIRGGERRERLWLNYGEQNCVGTRGGKELGPLMWIVSAKDTEISFYFLIGWFGLSVGLGMVGSG